MLFKGSVSNISTSILSSLYYMSIFHHYFQSAEYAHKSRRSHATSNGKLRSSITLKRIIKSSFKKRLTAAINNRVIMCFRKTHPCGNEYAEQPQGSFSSWTKVRQTFTFHFLYLQSRQWCQHHGS